MRVHRILPATVTVAFVLVLGAFQPSNQTPQEILNEEGYAAVMRRIDQTLGDVGMNIDATYWNELSDSSDRMTRFFEQIQTFWTAREVQPAIDFSAAALTATDAVRLAARARNGSQATQAMSDLRSVCRSCHTEFREEVGDGFRIKPGT